MWFGETGKGKIKNAKLNERIWKVENDKRRDEETLDNK